VTNAYGFVTKEIGGKLTGDNACVGVESRKVEGRKKEINKCVWGEPNYKRNPENSYEKGSGHVHWTEASVEVY